MSETGSIKMWVLAFVVLCGIGFGTLVGVGCAVGANQCPFSKHKAQTSLDGQTLYQTNCIGCHGVNGEGGHGDAPALRSYELVLSGWETFLYEQVPKLVYHLESIGAFLPDCRGVLISAFVGERLIDQNRPR